MQSYLEIWNEIKNKLKSELDQEVFDGYFSNINKIYKTAGDIIYLVVDNFFIKTRIQNGYLPKMNSFLSDYFSEPHYFSLITKDEIAKINEDE